MAKENKIANYAVHHFAYTIGGVLNVEIAGVVIALTDIGCIDVSNAK